MFFVIIIAHHVLSFLPKKQLNILGIYQTNLLFISFHSINTMACYTFDIFLLYGPVYLFPLASILVFIKTAWLDTYFSNKYVRILNFLLLYPWSYSNFK